MKVSLTLLLISSFVFSFSCQNRSGEQVKNGSDKKIGVLIANHGSHSKKWRNMLKQVEADVKDSILKLPSVHGVKTAFMEYTEPSIATQMKAFDEENYDEVIVIPMFLTVSSHYSHDIPVILGQKVDPKNVQELKKEKIEVYKPKANVSIAPTMNYTTLLKKNVERRVKDLMPDTKDAGVLLVAYGDAQYNQQWEELVEEIGKYLQAKQQIESIAYAWCGHLVSYSTQPTMDGISKLFELEDKVAVIPVLVANDPYFQNDIIQKAVDESENSDNVFYKQDAILPDNNLNQWIIDISRQTVNQLL
ncbi:MAG: CbiX/SirB N-terminal domain-containing protein [Cytophagales bacterium]|nr:CbiX/SirB N-terminal domain-containing protein [Cytophagales bacterium]